MMLYQEIVKNQPKIVPTQATQTELVHLKKGLSIENALFDVDDDVQNNLVSFRSIKYPLALDLFV
jgi:hypothetical protein